MTADRHQSSHFIPGGEPKSEAPRDGVHKKVARRKRIPWRWPKDAKVRRDQFQAWQGVAMKILNDNKASFRLMVLIERFLHWKSGTIWATDKQLAAHGGDCSPRTIKRDVAIYDDLGIIDKQLGWRKNSEGKFVRTRLIRIAVPEDLSPSIPLLEPLDHGDMRGPYELEDQNAIHGDTRGPSHGDTRGPIIPESALKKGAADAA